MMSSSQFKRKTYLFFHRRRSGMIQDIDKLLAEYHATVSENRKLKCQVYIYMMCKHYLSTKLHGKRRDGIQELFDEVKREIDSPEFKRKVMQKAHGLHYSRGIARDISTTSAASSTSLSSTYVYEGILPQKNFVKKMRLHMEELIGEQKYFSVSDMTVGGRPDLHMNLEHYRMSEILDRLYELWTDQESVREFCYLNSEQRIRYMLVIRNGRLYNYSDGQPHEGSSSVNFLGCPFAMDTDERLYTWTGNLKDWNHSSFLSGHPVIAAGIIWVSQGKLLQISNESGHYKPSPWDLAACVQVLVRSGLNPDFSVRLVQTPKVTKTLFNSATEFLTHYPLR